MRLLNKIIAPALPQTPPNPNKGYFDQYNGVLRLFFAALSNAVNSLLGTNGGRYLQVPNALFFDTGDQALDDVDVGQPVRFNQTYLDNAITINGPTTSQITVEHSGIYNIQFTGRVRSNSGSGKLVYLWIARDGTDITYSGEEYSVSGSGKELKIDWNFIIDIQAGSYIELMWTGNDIDLSLDHVAATAPHPGIASAVVAIFFVSALPEVLPVLP